MTVDLSKIKIKGKSVLTILLKVVSQHTQRGLRPFCATGIRGFTPTPQEQEQRHYELASLVFFQKQTPQ